MMKRCLQKGQRQLTSVQCAPKFCSMRISHDIREYAKENDLETTEAIEKGMKEKAEEFKEAGSHLYQ